MMTQFMMIKTSDNLDCPPGVYLRSIGTHEDFLQTVARGYFGSSATCRLVVDQTGVTEPLVDDVWDAQRTGQDLTRVGLVALARHLLDERIEFVCWCGNESHELPTVESWSEFLAQLRLQTNDQPADLYVHYRPSAGQR
jgi:hypothetical protein